MVRNKKQLLIFNITFFFFQFEAIGSGFFSIYRLIIFPLLCLGLFFVEKKITKRDLIPFYVFSAFTILQLISSFGYDQYDSIITITGQYLLFIYSYLFLKENARIKKSTLLIFSSYSLFHMLFFLKDFSLIGLAHRFTGHHWDPNYLCVYVLIGFWAKIYLMRFFSIKTVHQFILITFMVIDILMIFSSISKGGILVLLLSVLLYLFIYLRKYFYLLLCIIALFASYAFTRSIFLEWSENLNLVDSVIYRFITESVHSGDFTTGRSDFIQNYFVMLKQGYGTFLGMPVKYFIENYNNYMYPHNSLLEIFISIGFLPGIIFILYIIYNIIKTFRYIFHLRILPFYFITALNSMLILLFLSFYGLKITWFFLSILVLFINKKIWQKNFH